MLNKFWCLLVLFAIEHNRTYADIYAECVGNDQTYVEVKDDCSHYIFCHSEDSFSDSCPDDSPYFSIEEQTCDVNKNVCKDRPITKEITTDGEQVVEVSTLSTTPATPSIITIPTATAHNNLPSTTKFIVASTTTTVSSTRSTEIQLITTVLPSPSVPTLCPLVDNPYKAIFLPHRKSCSEYFLCFRGQRLPMRCSHMLHFDVRQQKCDYPENVKCHLMEIASPREQCLPHTLDVYPHPLNCNYYYQCTLGYLKVMQCPLNMGWHYEKRACVRRALAKCYDSFARAISK